MSQFVVIIDFSHLFHICRHRALEAASNDYDFMEALIYHFEGKMRTFQRSLESYHITEYDLVFAEDRQSLRKMGIEPTYKTHRQDLSHVKQDLKVLVKEKFPGHYFCWAEGEEADDVIATATKLATANGRLVTICTGDRDLWQLINESVSVFNPIKKALVTMDDVNHSFKVTPKHIPLVKSFWGDSSDGIPNVLPRMQKHLLPVIRLSDGTYEHCHSLIMSNPLPTKCLSLYREQEAHARRNYQLVKLHETCPLVWD